MAQAATPSRRSAQRGQEPQRHSELQSRGEVACVCRRGSIDAAARSWQQRQRRGRQRRMQQRGRGAGGRGARSGTPRADGSSSGARSGDASRAACSASAAAPLRPGASGEGGGAGRAGNDARSAVCASAAAPLAGKKSSAARGERRAGLRCSTAAATSRRATAARPPGERPIHARCREDALGSGDPAISSGRAAFCTLGGDDIAPSATGASRQPGQSPEKSESQIAPGPNFHPDPAGFRVCTPRAPGAGGGSSLETLCRERESIGQVTSRQTPPPRTRFLPGGRRWHEARDVQNVH